MYYYFYYYIGGGGGGKVKAAKDHGKKFRYELVTSFSAIVQCFYLSGSQITLKKGFRERVRTQRLEVLTFTALPFLDTKELKQLVSTHI